MSVNPCYTYSRTLCCMEKYPKREDTLVYSLDELKRISSTVTHVVLAIGGNDARSSFMQSFDTDKIY